MQIDFHRLSCSLAIIVAFVLVGFTSLKQNATKNNYREASNYFYFRFIGVSGEEQDRTKWQQIPSLSQYLLIPCYALHGGCKLTANDTVTIWGVTRPREVVAPINYTTFTRDPVESTFVVEVFNKNN